MELTLIAAKGICQETTDRTESILLVNTSTEILAVSHNCANISSTNWDKSTEIGVSELLPKKSNFLSTNGTYGWPPPESIHGYIQGELKSLSVDKVFEKLKEHLKS